MRILVVSDTHGNDSSLRRAILAQPKAEVVIHLGDGEEELLRAKRAFPEKMFLAVRGNCDWRSDWPGERIVELGGHRIFCTHGHLYGVKTAGTALLEKRAAEENCDIVLYGHTHVPRIDYIAGRYYLNPGSLRQPAEGRPGYIELNLDGKNTVPIRVEI